MNSRLSVLDEYDVEGTVLCPLQGAGRPIESEGSDVESGLAGVRGGARAARCSRRRGPLRRGA
eukprot:12074330-Alexandrium_andersonii.AAC.1